LYWKAYITAMLDTAKTHQHYKTFINKTWRQIWGKALGAYLAV